MGADGGYILHHRKHNMHLNIKLIWKKAISEFSIGRVTVILFLMPCEGEGQKNVIFIAKFLQNRN